MNAFPYRSADEDFGPDPVLTPLPSDGACCADVSCPGNHEDSGRIVMHFPARDTGGTLEAGRIRELFEGLPLEEPAVKPVRKMWLRTPDGDVVPLGDITADGISVLDDRDDTDFAGRPLGGTGSIRVPSASMPGLEYDPVAWNREDGASVGPEFLERLRNLPRVIELKPVRFKRPPLRSMLYGVFLPDRWNIVTETGPFDGPSFLVRKGLRRMIRVYSIAQGMNYIAREESRGDTTDPVV